MHFLLQAALWRLFPRLCQRILRQRPEGSFRPPDTRTGGIPPFPPIGAPRQSPRNPVADEGTAVWQELLPPQPHSSYGPHASTLRRPEHEETR